jgi:hypothetical protein
VAPNPVVQVRSSKSPVHWLVARVQGPSSAVAMALGFALLFSLNSSERWKLLPRSQLSSALKLGLLKDQRLRLGLDASYMPAERVSYECFRTD